MVAFAFLAVASAAALTGNEPVPILQQDMEVGFDGTYHSSFEAGNGITMEEHGVLKNLGNKETEAEEVAGSVSYLAPDNTQIQLTYVADENGFSPKGSHLPVAPPIPAAIARALEWIAAHPQPEEKKF